MTSIPSSPFTRRPSSPALDELAELSPATETGVTGKKLVKNDEVAHVPRPPRGPETPGEPPEVETSAGAHDGGEGAAVQAGSTVAGAAVQTDDAGDDTTMPAVKRPTGHVHRPPRGGDDDEPQGGAPEIPPRVEQASRLTLGCDKDGARCELRPKD